MIGMIFAQSSNGFIGKDGQLLFSIPADMKRFKELTKDSMVVMGRKTWDSLPEKFKPLPDRENIVLTRDREIKGGSYIGATVMHSLQEVVKHHMLRLSDPKVPMWIIGGESLYKEGLEYADVIHQTLVTKEFNGDAKAPYIDPDVWVNEIGRPFMEHDGLYYQFNTYKRK